MYYLLIYTTMHYKYDLIKSVPKLQSASYNYTSCSYTLPQVCLLEKCIKLLYVCILLSF